MLAIALVLLVHALLLLLAVASGRIQRSDAPEQIAFIGIWPEPPPEQPAPPEATPTVTTPAPRPRDRAPSPPPLAPGSAEQPIAPATPPAIAPETGPATAPITLPPIDWQREANAAARRHAQPPAGPESFSPGPETLRKPCEPPKSSFEWNPETPKAGFTRTPIPLPFVSLGERCVVGLGFFGCDMGPKTEANSHLFDDLKQGKTQESSVPHPDICD